MVLEQFIKEKKFMRIGVKTTICLVTLDNGFEIIGTSACLDPSTFDYEIGKEFAYKNALQKLADIEGFVLTEKMLIESSKESK